jgi:hypothetical protein
LVPHRKAATAPEREAQKRRRRKAKEGELPSKLDLALALVSLAVAAGVGATTVVGDSAFAVMWWLREVAALGRQWLVTTRQNRRLRIGAEIGAFRDWAKAASVTFVESGEKGSTLYGTLLPKAVLLDRHCQRKGLDCRPAYFERRNKAGKVIHRWYMVTSQWDWDLEAIWLHWSWRWQIEELHRDSKHSLLLSSFHVRTWEGIVALIACTCLRVNLVYFLRAVEPACGALFVEGLVPALSKAACHVQPQPSQSQWKVTLPPTLPATVLWQEDRLPLPQQYWPIVTKVA